MFRGMVQIHVPVFRHLPQRTIDHCKYPSDTGILPISVSNGLQQIPPGCRNVPQFRTTPIKWWHNDPHDARGT
jgi:hypothetical protein